MVFIKIERYNHIMSDNKDSILKVIEASETTVESGNKVQKNVNGHTNPLAKKFLEFHNEKQNKLKVKDLFKK